MQRQLGALRFGQSLLVLLGLSSSAELVYVGILVLQVGPSLHDHLPVEETAVLSALCSSSFPFLSMLQLLFGEEIATDRTIYDFLAFLQHDLVRLRRAPPVDVDRQGFVNRAHRAREGLTSLAAACCRAHQGTTWDPRALFR